jgi:hypothetical protein
VTTFGISSDPFNRRQYCCAWVPSLKTMVKVAMREPQPLVPWVRSRTVAKVDSIGLVVRRCDQCFVFFQALGRFWVLDLVATDRRLPARPFWLATDTSRGSAAWLGLARSWAFYLGGWPSCAPSNAAELPAIFFPQCDPEAERAITNGQFRCRL